MREYIRRVTDDERIANSGVTNSAYGRPMSSTITPPKSEMVRLANRPPWYTSLFFQLLVAIIAGILIGWLWPDLGGSFKPMADGFIKLIKMLIAPIIFARWCSVSHMWVI